MESIMRMLFSVSREDGEMGGNNRGKKKKEKKKGRHMTEIQQRQVQINYPKKQM